MEDRRCRKVLAVFLTTAIILSVFVPSASAAPEKSTDTLFKRVKNIKETILVDVVSDVNKTILANVKEHYFIKAIRDTFIGDKEKELAVRNSIKDNIVFVIEHIPLKEVFGSDTHKSVNTMTYTNNSNVSKSVSVNASSSIVSKKVNTVRENAAKKVSESSTKNENKNSVKTMAVTRSSGTEIIKEDLELLARIIHAEARGESFEGQVAVGAVVLNRVQHPDFPKSIKEVIYQPGQFTAVTDRQFELKPNDNAYKAAEAALEGQDPSNGAIFYYNPKIATDSWIKTRSTVRSIGNHKFCV